MQNLPVSHSLTTSYRVCISLILVSYSEYKVNQSHICKQFIIKNLLVKICLQFPVLKFANPFYIKSELVSHVVDCFLKREHRFVIIWTFTKFLKTNYKVFISLTFVNYFWYRMHLSHICKLFFIRVNHTFVNYFYYRGNQFQDYKLFLVSHL